MYTQKMAGDIFAYEIDSPVIRKGGDNYKSDTHPGKAESTFFCVFNNFLWVVQNEIDRRVVHQISGNQRKNNRIQENSGRHFSLDRHDFGVEGGKHGGQKNINNSMIYNLREKQINAAC